MGTSSSGGGAGGGHPLEPSWIASGSGNADVGGDPNGNGGNSEGGDGNPGDQQSSQNPNPNNPNQDAGERQSSPSPNQRSPSDKNRYKQSKKDFNKFVGSNGQNASYLKSALSGYVKKGSGGSSVLSRRMRPSTSRVAVFINTFNDIRTSGKTTALQQFNLTSYTNKPLNETLAALSDVIFQDTQRIYEDTRDDSITRQAYSNTVIRICELDSIDLNNLTNENIEVMTAIFIEETISQRVISDIGNKLTKLSNDVAKLVEIENNVYQIVKGLVRNQIMPEIKATQLGDKKDLEKNIENIYRIAFDAIIKASD